MLMDALRSVDPKDTTFLDVGGCVSGGRAACLLIGRLMVQSPAPAGCMLKYP